MSIGDKAKAFLKSEDVEKHSDAALDRAASLANEKTGGKHANKVTQVRDTLDKKIGSE